MHDEATLSTPTQFGVVVAVLIIAPGADAPGAVNERTNRTVVEAALEIRGCRS